MLLRKKATYTQSEFATTASCSQNNKLSASKQLVLQARAGAFLIHSNVQSRDEPQQEECLVGKAQMVQRQPCKEYVALVERSDCLQLELIILFHIE